MYYSFLLNIFILFYNSSILEFIISKNIIFKKKTTKNKKIVKVLIKRNLKYTKLI